MKSQIGKGIRSIHDRFGVARSGLLALATLSFITCTGDSPQIGIAEQAAVVTLPDLDLVLNAKTTVTIGASSFVSGDVASTGPTGIVIFDVGSRQGFGNNVLGNTVETRVDTFVGHVFGNDLLIEGSTNGQSLGFDPSKLPPVPAATAAAPGTVNVSVPENRARQLCAGQYGAMALGRNATLNLNGGVYHVTKLTLADGAKLEPSEPVVIVVGGNVLTGVSSFIRPSAQALSPMTAADIRIEVGGAATLGESSQTRAHLLLPNGKLTTTKSVSLTGAAWAKTIAIGTNNSIEREGTFSAQTPTGLVACSDNNPCTADACVGGGTAIGFCTASPVPSGTTCEDGNFCNGAEACNATGQCLSGAPPAAGTSCADDTVCNGDETCDGIATCQGGAPPVVNDRESCTTDVCDPVTGVEHETLPDGTTCSGTGVCEGGVCSVQATVFSEFFQFEDAPAQCDSWNAFLGELTASSYSSVTMSGTFDPIGVTCNDPARATQICQAMHSGTSLSVFCNGRTWRVGECGGTELTANGSPCSCSFGYTARPCIGFRQWGGMNTESCEAPSQTMTVICQ